jgi:hypothetical protein
MSMASAFGRALAVVVAVALAAPAIAGAADPPRYRAYYDVFDRGPANVPGLETSLVPQGLTYWAARDALIISYYDTAGGPSRIAVVDRNSGRCIKTLLLRTTGHVGGLGMTQSGHLWVATNNELSLPGQHPGPERRGPDGRLRPHLPASRIVVRRRARQRPLGRAVQAVGHPFLPTRTVSTPSAGCSGPA